MDGLGRGFRDKEIAEQLGISLFTVRSHLRAVMLKAGANTRAHLIQIALDDGVTFGTDVVETEPDGLGVASVPPKLRFQVLTRDGFRCTYCGASPPEVKLHVDHRIPRSAGGETTLDNLFTACDRCNFGKGKSALVTFGEQT